MAAIARANSTPGPDTLVLEAGCTYVLTKVDNVGGHGPNGLPLISTAITLAGPATIARSSGAGTPPFRILEIAATGSLSLSDVTVTGGRTPSGASGPAGAAGAAGLNVRPTGFGIGGAGGAGGAGGVGRDGLPGGGIFNAGTLRLSTSTVAANITGAGGAGGTGGMGGTGGSAMGNHVAGGRGGDGGTGGMGGTGGAGAGIFNTGSLWIASSTISANETGRGGPGGDGRRGGTGGFARGGIAIGGAGGNGRGGGTGGEGGAGAGVANKGQMVVIHGLIARNTTGAAGSGGMGGPGGAGGSAEGGTFEQPGPRGSTGLGGSAGTAGAGGGVDSSGLLRMAGGTITDNQAHSGGGIHNTGTAELVATTVAGNRPDQCVGVPSC